MTMTTFQILMVTFVGLIVIGGLVALIIYLTRRNNNNTNICNGPINVPNSQLHIPEQNISIASYISICNRRNLFWIISAVLGVLFVLFLVLFLTANNSNKNEQTANAQQVNPPTITPPVVVTTPAPVDLKPVTDAIDSSTTKIVNKVDEVNKNLTAHRESSKRGYTAQNKKLDDIKAGVEGNSKKLDEVKSKLEMIDANITAGRGELQVKINELKNLLANGSANPDEINKLTNQINKLRTDIEKLLQQKKSIGDPD